MKMGSRTRLVTVPAAMHFRAYRGRPSARMTAVKAGQII